MQRLRGDFGMIIDMKKVTAALTDKTSWLKRAEDVFDTETESMVLTRNSLGASFTDAVEILLKALRSGGRIVLSGVGKNVPVAEKISATMASTGSCSIVLNPVQAMHGDLGILSANDALVALSFSGESEEMTRLLPAIRRRGIPVVSITGRKDCSMAKLSDVVLTVDTPHEADPFDMAPTASTTATLAMGDALAMVLTDLTLFSKESYALLHPAGAIGKTLLTGVKDIMRTGDALVAVPKEATIRDALFAMTRAKSGAAYIIDGAGRLEAIFTDGDLRRSLTEGGAALESPLSAVMTRNPISVSSEKMASDVLKIFRMHSIDDIPVVDNDGVLVGAVDISDLPKLKVL